MSLLIPTHQLTATVLGAGTMGAQIAAHLANAGIRTFLLDRVPEGVPAGARAEQRNALALGAMAVMAKARPAPFMLPQFAERIRVGNLDDDLERAVAASDLVVEAVVERLDVKRPLFERIAAAARPHAVLATNTSGLSIAAIAETLAPDVRKRIVGMHFFNPPRYMHLLEVVPSIYTDPAVARELGEFSDRVLGKGVVDCRDTPNFIGNRVGIAEMLLTFKATFEGGYTLEEVDVLNGPLMGRPKTASFRLGDLVGLDVAGHVIRNLKVALSSDPKADNYDELHGIMDVPAVIERMLERGMLGDKTGQGFYKKVRGANGESTVLSLDVGTFEYRARIEPNLPELASVAKIPRLAERVAAALRLEGRAGTFLRAVYLPLMNYAANRVGTICETPKQIDDAMCWGYGWKAGPFALWDAAGIAWSLDELRKLRIEPAPAVLELAQQAGATWYGGTPAAPKVFVPGRGQTDVPRPAGVLVLDACKPEREFHTTATAGLLDIGDGVACVEFRSKMNVFDEGVVTLLQQVFDVLERRGGFRALVIGNQAEHFSAGADARRILAWAKDRNFDAIARGVAEFQDVQMSLRHALVPVVVAPHGMTLGGGAECVLHGAAVQANAELYMGLVEAGIGLVPAGGGLKELVRRAAAWAAQVPDGDPYPFLRRAFECAAQGKVSTSADEARALGFLGPNDGITFHRARVVADAKRRAIAIAEGGYVPPDRNEAIRVVGAPHGASFMLGAWQFEQGGYASSHDRLVAEKIAHVLSGGMTPTSTTVTAQQLLDLEREAFVSLCGEAKTQARIEHTLKTGKPLRN